MNTIRLTKPGLFERIDSEEPSELPEGMALVRVRHVGLCGTDIHAYRGRQPFFEYPRILGHELGVEIEALNGDYPGLEVGARCSVEPYLARPGDKAYERGKTNCSSSTRCMGVHVDGGMRERIVIPANLLHPSTMSTDKIALVETLCIGHHAVERASLIGDEKVAVIGMGPIGLGVTQIAQLAGVSVTCIDVSDTRLAVARTLIPQIKTLLIEGGEDLTHTWDSKIGERPEVVFDCTGSQQSMEATIELPDFGGRIVLVGIYNGELTFSDPSFHKRELSLISSRNARSANFKEVIAMMENGSIDVSPWITHLCSASQFPDVINDWLKPESGLLKGVIKF